MAPKPPPRAPKASPSLDFHRFWADFKRFFDDFLYQVGYFLSGLPHYFFGYLAKKWGRQQPPCIIASHFTMCVLVWVFERGSLATPFLPSKMKCLFHTAGEILGVGGIGRQASTISKASCFCWHPIASCVKSIVICMHPIETNIKSIVFLLASYRLMC